MLKKYFILYILLIIVFNIILFCYYKNLKENFGNINDGINVFKIIYRPNNKDEYLSILKTAITNKYRNIIVIDKDVKLTQKKELIDKRIEEFLNRFGNDWDVLQLTNSKKGYIKTEIYPGLDSVSKGELHGAFIINSSIFNKLHETLKNNLKLDTLQKETKWYMFTPGI